jgi:hypothetical protein
MDRKTSNYMLLGAVAAGIACAGALVLYLFDPTRYGFYPVCLFHRTTGLLCPGCGSLRALHHLLHGHVAEAFRYNALLMTLLPVATAWLLLRLSARRGWAKPIPLNIGTAGLWIALVVFLGFGVFRNLPFLASSLGIP